MKIGSAVLFFTISILVTTAGQAQSVADNWHQWRGPENNGVSRTADPPVEWSEEKNVAWKIEIGGHGTSSPIVWGNKVFVTTAVNTEKVDPSLPKPEDQPERVFGIKHPNTSYQMTVLCIDKKTGKELWRDVARTLVPHEGHHRDASFASASPFCDDKRIYCWFGSGGLFAYSHDGKKLWERDLGRAKMGASLGEGSSPVVHDGKIVIVRDHAGQSTIEVLDANSGKPVWKKDRDEKNAWATPAIAKHNGVTQVITCASNKVRSYNLKTGEIIWEAKGLTGNCTPCPIVDGEVVYCMSGYEGYSLLAIPITGKGDVTDSVLWKVKRGTPYVPSPIFYDGLLYFTQSNQNIMTCVDVKDGSRVIERDRLPGLGGVYSSPVGAAGRIYMTDRKGTILVLARGRETKVLATNELDDNFHASPALAGKQLFLRGMRFLYCLEEGRTPAKQKVVSKLPAEKKLPTASPPKSTRDLLVQIAKRELPKDYPGGKGHQPFVDKWFANAPPEKSSRVGQLWKEQERLFPDMKNRGESFIRILDYVRTNGGKPTAPKQQGNANPHIKRVVKAEIRVEEGKPAGERGSVSGLVRNQGGEPMGGVMVSAFDKGRRMTTSVFSQPDGKFRIDDLAEGDVRVRARLLGQFDRFIEDVKLGASDLEFTMESATGIDLENQRPSDSAFSMLKFDNVRDRLNFKMMCAYCHQIGTRGFRAPEQPVDWDTMIRRMDGFGGLYPHTKETIVQRIIDTYKDNAVNNWPPYEPPPAPTGMAANVKITTWEMGEMLEGSFHDLEIGPDDGLAYVVHIGRQYTATLDPETTERIYYRLPRGSHGPHSIEPDNEGQMWLTLCVSGEMAKFDLQTKEYTITSSAEPPADRGSWPHTLRVDPKDPEGLIWYTDAGRNSVFRLHPKTLERKEYHLLEAGQVKAGGKGESRGITPYGLDYSPVDGKIWYSKLNGNRIGRIDPKVPDGDITEWNPPFRGPRRLHVAPDGMVWVPGFGSGVFGKFDPSTEEWTVYPLPNYQNQIPYALNVAPDGMVWVCGTGNDTLYRFNPKTEYLVEFRMPAQVTYTREIEFDKDGNIWTSNSQAPVRHMENGCGGIIKLEILDKDEKEMGGIKLAPIELSLDEQGLQSAKDRQEIAAKLGPLFTKIEARDLPKGYHGETHQVYVDRVMATLTEEQRERVGRLFQQRRRAKVKITNVGQSFIKILDYVAQGGRTAKVSAGQGPGAGPKESIEKKTGIHRLDSSLRSPFDAFVYVNRIPGRAREGESPKDFAGRIYGRLANQEGRIQIKLPPGMDLSAYRGFKTFLGSEGNPAISNCAACHAGPEFSAEGSSLRNLKLTEEKLESIIRGKMAKAAGGDANYAGLKIDEGDVAELISFLQSLKRVSDERFRELIIDVKVTDVTAEVAPVAPAVPALRGTVRFEGLRPERNRLPMDEPSRKLYNGKSAFDESILISKSGGLANVFVHVQTPVRGDFPVPKAPAVIDQQKSVFRPRVQGLRVGQELVMKNGDPFIHNIRSLSRKNRPFNIAQPTGSPDRRKIFEAAEGPITIKCDFHRWMTAHFWVMDHPFFAVTDNEGRFSIPNLPPGKYTLAAWHEVFGEQEVKVTVGKDSPSSAEFTFSPKKD
ncbi:PQQ-binding-like beta-propeller repeat protein [Verrucomicrobiales bacterium]|nr:PQQ-binding-like beta-propeller repeat protein [Verrucomicrobiales bacterium]